MREGFEGGHRLLEPIMKVEVVTPEDYLGDVIGDLNSRRGRFRAPIPAAMPRRHQGICPACQHVRLRQHLRSMTQGRAQYTMQFDHYDEVPANVAAEVKEKLA
jgi:elongation factor G